MTSTEAIDVLSDIRIETEHQLLLQWIKEPEYYARMEALEMAI